MQPIIQATAVVSLSEVMVPSFLLLLWKPVEAIYLKHVHPCGVVIVLLVLQLVRLTPLPIDVTIGTVIYYIPTCTVLNACCLYIGTLVCHRLATKALYAKYRLWDKHK